MKKLIDLKRCLSGLSCPSENDSKDYYLYLL